MFPDLRQSGYVLPVPTTGETRLRHSGWAAARARVRSALLAASAPAARVERFDACGAGAWVEYSDVGGVYRLKACYCHDRFCVPCCGAKAAKLARRVVSAPLAGEVRLVTLTLADDGQPLHERLNRLQASYATLRRTRLWKRAVKSSMATYEVTRGRAGDHWHVHLHAVVDGGYLSQAGLSAAWHEATGDSYIVDVRAVDDPRRGIEYVAKYAGKGVDASVLRDHDALIEAITALRGRRLLLFTGVWRVVAAIKVPSRYDDWRDVGNLVQVVRAYHRNEPVAVAAVLSLRLWGMMDGEGTESRPGGLDSVDGPGV
jgi:hypothetical protein